MKFTIENIEEFSGGMAQIYSVMFEGDDMTLMDHFFEDNAQYTEELEEMAKKLESMGNDTGCRIQFFKENEGAPGDGVVAFWYKRMRLYCLRIGSACIILGDAGDISHQTFRLTKKMNYLTLKPNRCANYQHVSTKQLLKKT